MEARRQARRHLLRHLRDRGVNDSPFGGAPSLRRGGAPFSLNPKMEETSEPKLPPPEAEYLGVRGYFIELLHGIGEMAGLGLLWSLEAVRNVFFRVLDRVNVKARPPRRVSAFPPGKPRSRKTA